MKKKKSFNSSINNLKAVITSFKNENRKSKSIFENSKVFSTTTETGDTFVIFATTSASVTLFVIGFGLVGVPLSTGFACGLTLIKKI